FEYTITDNFNGRATAQLVVVIQGINDAPLAVDDSITIFEDTHITFVEEQFGLLSNDGDIDRDPIIVAVNDQDNFSSNGRYGRLTWQPNGAFEYQTFVEIVDSLYQGQEVIDEFTYTIVDPLGLTDRASLFITIIGQNDAPVANDFSIATHEKAPPLTISSRSQGIVSNDIDIDDATEFGIVDIENDQSGTVDGKYGSLQWNYDGTFIYNLNEAMDSLMLNECVVDSFSYTIQDRFDSVDIAWFVIEITGDNDTPVAVSDTLYLNEDDITLLPDWSLLDNDFDTDGDSLFMNAMNGNPNSPVSTRFAMFDWNALGNFTYNRYEYGNKRIELDTLAWNDLVIDSIAYNIADTNGVQAMAYLFLEIEGVNDAPFTKSDANYINENSTSISSLSNNHILSNDFDVDRGDSIMLMNIEGDTSGLVIGKYGQLEWLQTGHYTFFNNFDAVDTLAQSERAYDIFRYTISDRQGALTIDSLVITIIGANDRPVAVNDTILINEDERFVEIYPDNNGLLWNDYDVDGDSIYIALEENTVLIEGKYGTLNISATGEASYTMNNEIDSLASNQNVKDIFDYTLFDVLGSSSKAKVIINIVGNNDLPVVPDVFVQTDEDFDSIVATIDSEYALLFAASDIDGDTLNVIEVNDSTALFMQGIYGNLFWKNDGSYVYENNLLTTQPLMQGDTVYEQFTFVVADPFEGYDTAIFTIEILGLNDAPWASPDFYETIENNRVALSSSMPDHILYNDIDIDGDDFEISNVNLITSTSLNGEYGRLNWQPDGSFEYFPDTLIAMALRPGETLTEVFVYEVEDIYNAADTSTVNITIVGINNPPLVVNDTLEIRGKNLIATLDHSLLINAADPDRDTLKVARLESDTTGLYYDENYGQVVWTVDGALQYLSDSAFFMQLGPTEQARRPYSFTIIDEAGEIGRAELIVMFYGENEAPTAFNDSVSINEDEFAIVDVVENDIDPDYGTSTGNIDFGSLSVTVSPRNGKAQVNTATGEIYYFPNENFNGSDSLLYSICDQGHPVYCSEAWLFIEVKPVNDPPRARHLVISTPLNTPVSFNAFYQVEDVDDGVDPLSGKLVDMPASGTAEWPADSLITYIPDLDFTGVDEFTYSLADYQGENAYVIVNVIVPDDRFGAQNDTVITQENKVVDINVLVNDTLNGFEPSPNLLSIKVFPVNGTAGYNPFTRNITYQPNQNFHGVDSLVYIVGSKTENWDFAILYIRVEPVNRPLVANNDAVTTFINAPVQIRILQNDYDYDDGIDTSSVRILVQPQNSKTDIQFDFNTGYAYYTPLDEYKGYDSFTYLVCDLNTDMPSCDTATVEILVRSRHEDFIAQNDYYPIEEGQTALLNNPHPINNDGNEQNMPMLESFTVITSPQFGEYSLIESNKVISYTPNENYFGPDWIDYRVCDSNNNCDFAQINIWVEPVNNAPVAIDDSYVVNENVQKRFYVLANDFDVDGILNFASLDTVAGEGPRKGELIIDRNTGTMLYTPQINSDVDRFNYRICDNEGNCSEATVMVIVDLGNTILHYQTVTEDVPDTFSVKPPMAAYNLFFDIADTLEIMAPEMGAWDMIFDNIDPRIVYNPMHDSTGNDYYNVVLYAENGDSVDLRVYVEIIPVNDAPVAMPDTIVWNEPSDSTIVHYWQLLNNDFDVDGDQLLLTEAITNTSDSFSFAWNADSTFTIYSDSINWCEAWFYYQISDADGETSEAMVWITPILTGLIAVNDTVSVEENSGNNQFDVLLNDSIKDNQRCTIDSLYIITMPLNGIADVSSEKMVLYRSNETYYGPDSLQYVIVDIWEQTDSAWVYIDVLQRNNPPVAVADVVENDFDQVLIITALDNDYDPDPDGYIDTIRTHINIDELPLYGTVVYSPDSGWFVYTPFELVCEGDQFSYTIYDNEGDSASTTVTIQLPAEANIVAVIDTVKTWPGVPKDFNVLQNDIGFFLPYVENYTQPQIGSVDQIGDSTFTYYSNPETMEKDSMTYELVSPCGNFVVGKVIFVIEELRVPEIITPNGDGKNDVLIIDGIEYFPESMLRIYNRYGHVVYVKRGYTSDWDGHSNQGSLGGDKPLPSGTYYYTLEYNEGRNKQSGIIYIFN
ncbi:MAG: tandem-95 repeat protein, partial [Prolixibacteraceae bacterium]|nr:tandem-95 repeat protein [Prolixibacteraceae bacterium]